MAKNEILDQLASVDGEIGFSSETKRDAFLTVQFNALRQEIELQIAERRRVEAQTFIGLAAVYAWIFTNAENLTSGYRVALFAVPVIFSILGLLRWGGIMYRIMTLARYNQKIETMIIGKTGGWEAYLAGVRKRQPIVGRLEGIAEICAWTMTIAGTLTALVLASIS